MHKPIEKNFPRQKQEQERLFQSNYYLLKNKKIKKENYLLLLVHLHPFSFPKKKEKKKKKRK